MVSNMKFSADGYLDEVRHYEKDLRFSTTPYTVFAASTITTRRHQFTQNSGSLSGRMRLGLSVRLKVTKHKEARYSRVANLFIDNGKQLDEVIDELTTLAEPLSPEKLETVTCLHGRMVKILTDRPEATGKDLGHVRCSDARFIGAGSGLRHDDCAKRLR
jgi:hypothetical protein